jgi:hypothetical protein
MRWAARWKRRWLTAPLLVEQRHVDQHSRETLKRVHKSTKPRKFRFAAS